MKDVKGMSREEKHRYIFEDKSFENRPRVKWITDCLLGDIRTFLYCIENRIKEKHAGKAFSDGFGNLSIPILISTALEFVAALYTGKTKYKDGGRYKAIENVKEFIKKYFPEFYKKMPTIFWDGVRNGHVHTFYPKSFEHQGKHTYIRFGFYVEDQNYPSHIRKRDNTIWICINVFELFRVLESAIRDYLNELKCDEKLQDNFIMAWSSIEDYIESVDKNQKEEMNELEAYLGRDSSAPLILINFRKE